MRIDGRRMKEGEEGRKMREEGRMGMKRKHADERKKER